MEKDPQKTILVIEDDNDVLSMIVKHLKFSGYNVITAMDGMEGLKKIRAGGFNLVITDIVMPYVSGTGLISALKEKYPKIPAVANTGFGDEPLETAKEKMADVMLNKPFHMSTFIGHVDKLLHANTPL